MIAPLSDRLVPLDVRVAAADAALAYANALAQGDEGKRQHIALVRACEDVAICMRASELGMV